MPKFELKEERTTIGRLVYVYNGQDEVCDGCVFEDVDSNFCDRGICENGILEIEMEEE